jgi:hypothetical protein
MAQTVNAPLPPFDANQAITNPMRSIGPAIKYRLVTAGQDLGTTARWLSVGANGGSGGTITYISPDGATVSNFPVDPGYHFLLFTKIVSITGATNLWWSD